MSPLESRDRSGATPPRRRSRKSRLLELLLWTTVALVTAVILISLSEWLLPTNF